MMSVRLILMLTAALFGSRVDCQILRHSSLATGTNVTFVWNFEGVKDGKEPVSPLPEIIM